MAVSVADHLHFHVAGLLDIFFQVHLGVAKGALRLGGGHREALCKAHVVARHTHALPPAARGGLDQNRISEPLRPRQRLFLGLEGTIAARRDRYARPAHRLPSLGFVAHRPDVVRSRPDEGDVAVLADLREMRVFGQKAIPRMNRVNVRDFSRADQVGDFKVAVGRRRRPNTHGFVGQLDMQR